MVFSVCNELFGDMELEKSFATIRECGFDGVEIAPHTVFGDFSSDMTADTDRIRRALAQEGLEFVGLHWLLVGPPGLRASTPDEKAWRATWDHVARLADLAGELGGGVMVFGSPAQRASGGELPPADALKRFLDGLLSVADRVAAANSRLLLEALGSSHTDIMNTLGEVCEIVGRVNHPAVGTLFDFHNVEDETLDWAGIVTEYCAHISHVHLNEPDGEAPQPDSPNLAEFREAFAALVRNGYDQWVSLEMFSFPEDPAKVLRGVRSFLEAVWR